VTKDVEGLQEQPNKVSPASDPGQATIPMGVVTQLLSNPALSNPALPGAAQQVSMLQVQQALWHGPYPPPDALAEYERILPGSFDRMMSQTERLQAAQIEQSAAALTYQRDDNRRGHWLGFAISLIALITAGLCAFFKEPWLGAAALSVPVMAVAKALIESTRKG